MKAQPLPRLRIRRGYRSVLISQRPGHRAFAMRRFWMVLLCESTGESVMYAGRDDGVIGWVDCVDWANATVKRAMSQ